MGLWIFMKHWQKNSREPPWFLAYFLSTIISFFLSFIRTIYNKTLKALYLNYCKVVKMQKRGGTVAFDTKQSSTYFFTGCLLWHKRFFAYWYHFISLFHPPNEYIYIHCWMKCIFRRKASQINLTFISFLFIFPLN